MGLALTNPNDRRRINAAARAHVKTGAPIAALVKDIVAGTSAMKIKQKHGLYSKKGTKGQRISAGIAAGKSMSKGEARDRKTALASAKRRIAKALEGHKGYGPSATYSFGKKKTQSYSSRALGSQAARYRLKAKRSAKRVSKKGKTYKVGGRSYAWTDASTIQKWDKNRAARRKAGKSGHAKPFGRGASAPARKRATGRSTANNQAKLAMKIRQERGVSLKEAWAIVKGKGSTPGLMVGNPGVFGGLALTNPAYDMMGFAKYSATAVVAGGVSYKIHQIAVPWVQENIYDRIPVVGEYLNQYPYAATGVIASGALGLAAAKIGGTLGAYLAVVAGGVAMAGGVLQAQEMFGGESSDLEEAELAGLALTNPGVFGGLALENNAHAMGGLALENPHDMAHLNGIALENYGFGDGMAYQVSPLAMPDFSEGISEYSGASLADAITSGADLSVDEGNAAVLGKQAYLRRFGQPTVRMYSMGAPKGRSHLAGRPGHRWGWLIKMIGFERFQSLAALPPQKRLAVIKKMRASAIEAFKAEMADSGVPPLQPEFVSGNTATAASAAYAPEASYGAMLMASPSYL